MAEVSEMLLLKWQGNNSKHYDGKINKEYLKNIMKRDKSKELKVGDNVEVKYGRSSIWKATVVQYPLKVEKKRKKKGLCFTLCSVVCMYIICVY